MKRMTNRALVLSLVFFAALAAGAFAIQNSVAVVDRKDEVAQTAYTNALKKHENTVGVVSHLADKANTALEWQDVLAKASAFPPDAKDYFAARANIGQLEALAAERDRLFLNAGELFAANEKDPDIRKILDKARQLHERADAIVQKLPSNTGDPSWTLALQYRKAYEKYRSLAFLDPKEHDKALDVIDDIMSNLRLANKAAPKNNDVELFMEFVYKRAKEEEKARGGGQASGRPRALPPRGPQDSPGTGGQDRQRRH